MSSRKKRKRYRRRAEATDKTEANPQLLGGWGPGTDFTISDINILKQAHREGWDVDLDKIHSICYELRKVFNDESVPFNRRMKVMMFFVKCCR